MFNLSTNAKLYIALLIISTVLSLWAYNKYQSHVIDEQKALIETQERQLITRENAIKAQQEHFKNVQRNAIKHSDNKKNIEGIKDEKSINDAYDSIVNGK